jgi:hypothetical protein
VLAAFNSPGSLNSAMGIFGAAREAYQRILARVGSTNGWHGKPPVRTTYPSARGINPGLFSGHRTFGTTSDLSLKNRVRPRYYRARARSLTVAGMNRSDLSEEGERSLSSDFFSCPPPFEHKNDDEHEHDYKAEGTGQMPKTDPSIRATTMIEDTTTIGDRSDVSALGAPTVDALMSCFSFPLSVEPAGGKRRSRKEFQPLVGTTSDTSLNVAQHLTCPQYLTSPNI